MLGGSGGGWSGEDFSYHSAVHVCESEVATLEAIGELLMVEAEKVEEGGVQVVEVDDEPRPDDPPKLTDGQ